MNPEKANPTNLMCVRLPSGQRRAVLNFRADEECMANLALLKEGTLAITGSYLSYGLIIRRALDLYAQSLQDEIFDAAATPGDGESATDKLDRLRDSMKAEAVALKACAGEKRGRKPGQKNKAKEIGK
jgi:hypothetical protein